VQAAVLQRYNSPLEIIERPDLRPPAGWILVDVRACGVCGSDVFLRKGGFNSTLPITPGHEASGVVAELGEGVDPSVAPPGTGIIQRERPDVLLPTLGGQTALNLAMELIEAGVVDKYGVEVIGADIKEHAVVIFDTAR